MAPMAASATAFCVALLLVSLPRAHPAPEPQTTGSSSSSCTTELLRLLPCLSFLDGGAAAPPDTCCANLGSMVHDQPLCLCQALSQSGSGRAPSSGTRTITAGEHARHECELHCSIDADADDADATADNSRTDDHQPEFGIQQRVQAHS
uniref:Bifunctional inhibitor/plant lipid transfer protein/seed storage helical domain-containing protein n=1 Tax=Aegilops tauschii TaxID=37682 RepID=M8B3B0_AEGTA